MSNLIIKRPENIFELFSSLLNINGVGEKKLRLLEKKIGPYIINMQPYKFRNKNNISRIITFGLDEEKSIRLDIIYFGKNTQYLKNIYKVGNKIIISGKFESFNGLGQIVHPDYVLTDNQRSQIPKIEPVYPLFLGVNQKFIYKIINQSIKRIPNIPEWLSNKVVEKYKFSNWQDSITKLHNPENIADAELNSIYRRRLAFDELVANQISMLLIKNKISKINRNLPSKNNSQIIEKFYKSLPFKLTKNQIEVVNEIIEKFYKSLPFKLTKNQIEVVNEIKKDIHDEKTMVRMLQGDVGSGKTIVALISMLHAISDGSQSVLLVPTEILALQHYNTVKNLLTPINIEVVLLLGESRSIHSKKERMEIINNIAEGNVKVIIGTHALISKKVTYKNLSLAVIDEQHRFGVKQRYEITQKSTNVNILVMTATPIPRSLALTAYGDMDISIINEKPRGRQPIKTYVLPQSKINEVLLSMERAIKNGALIYWVCPLIEESENIDLIAVNERFDFLINYFPNIDISLVHGKQNQIEREKAINNFKIGKSKVLVATTVIEVGVDIPDATIMVIECAERFGLSQIHQLRGRVGRSNKESSCILLYKSQLNPIAHSRLKILKETDDGFKISENDLILRGPGEVLGSKQSGSIDFKFIDLHLHGDLIPVARDEAVNLLNNDNDHEKINTLLSIFENNEAIKLLKGG